MTLSNASTSIENQTFGAGVTKNVKQREQFMIFSTLSAFSKYNMSFKNLLDTSCKKRVL